MVDIPEWLDHHDAELGHIAAERELDPDAVKVVAALILRGLGDRAILDEIGERLLVMDGQTNPRARILEAIANVRDLVTAA